MSRRLMSTESVGVDVSVFALGVMPRAPRSAVGVAGSILPSSCIGPALLPLRVSPFEHHNIWHCLDTDSDCQVGKWKDDVSDGSEAGMACAVDHLRVYGVSEESLARLDVEEVVPPVREVRPPDPDSVPQHLRPLSAAVTSRVVNKQWKALGPRRMRGKKVKKVDGKPIRTVAGFTALSPVIWKH